MPYLACRQGSFDGIPCYLIRMPSNGRSPRDITRRWWKAHFSCSCLTGRSHAQHYYATVQTPELLAVESTTGLQQRAPAFIRSPVNLDNGILHEPIETVGSCQYVPRGLGMRQQRGGCAATGPALTGR